MLFRIRIHCWTLNGLFFAQFSLNSFRVRLCSTYFFFFLSLNIHISIFHLILWYSPQFQNCQTTNNCITSSNKKKHQRTVKSYFVVVVLLYFVCVFKMSHLPLDLSIVNKRRLVLCFCYKWLMGQKISVASVRNNCRLKCICGSNCVCCS